MHGRHSHHCVQPGVMQLCDPTWGREKQESSHIFKVELGRTWSQVDVAR
jgi:hypothetical protein